MFCGREQCSWRVPYHILRPSFQQLFVVTTCCWALRTTGIGHSKLYHSYPRRTKHFLAHSLHLKLLTSSCQITMNATFCQNLGFLAAWKIWKFVFLPPSFFLIFLLKLSSFHHIRHNKRRELDWVLGDPIYDICCINKGIKRISTSGSASWMQGPAVALRDTGQILHIMQRQTELASKRWISVIVSDIVHLFVC